MEPKVGLLTFRVEGNDIASSRYFSRKIHWPGVPSKCNAYSSGVTVGGSYDTKYRSLSQIIHHFTLAGVPIAQAKKIAEGAKKRFCSANAFVKYNKEAIGEITAHQQVKLFEIIYPHYVSDAIRFYNKYKQHDAAPWEKLHQVLRDVFIDMKYQGVLDHKMVPTFGLNNRAAIIRLIRSNPMLLRDEVARGRVQHITGGR